MGMYDTFHPRLDKLGLTDIEKENLQDGWWQTKGFENILTEVFWNEDDTLSIDTRENRRFPSKKGDIVPITDSGSFQFYTNDVNDQWYEYQILYSKGKVIEINRLSE